MNIYKMLLSILIVFPVLFAQEIFAETEITDSSETAEIVKEIPADTSDTKVADSPHLLPDAPKNKTPIIAEKPVNSTDDIKSGSSGETENIENTETDKTGLLNRVIEAAIILVLSVLLILGIRSLFDRLSKSMVLYSKKYFKTVKIKKYQILSEQQVLNGALFLVKVTKYSLSLLVLFLTIPIIFGIFPQTHDLAVTLWGYFLSPLKTIFFSVVYYIPKLVTIIVTLLVVRYVLKMLRLFSDQVEKGKLVIRGFYPDWAKPTYILLKYLICIFTIALIYPYLPNSDSNIFRGISVFVGVIISIGSTSAIGNLVAGIMITYMRPFKIGDRIQIGDNVGIVVEKNAVVVKIQTDKNEYVTLPNMTILTSSITNFGQSNGMGNSLIIHTKITYNYALEWRKVHELLITAAKKTQFIEKTPEPFVLQKALDDFYCVYEINAYTKEVGRIMKIYSELHENIQDVFLEAGMDMTAPHYEIYEKKGDPVQG